MPGESKYKYVPCPKNQTGADAAYFFAVARNGVIVPESVLQKFGFITMGRTWMVRSDVIHAIRLVAFTNVGSRRHPSWKLDGVYAVKPDGTVEPVDVSPDFKERYAEAFELWRIAMQPVEAPPSLPPEPGIYCTSYSCRVQWGDVTVLIEERHGRAPYYLAKYWGVPPTVEGELVKMLASFGFQKGQYGGMITRGKLNLQEVAKAIADFLVSRRAEMEEHVATRASAEISARIREIEEARRRLGLDVPAGKPIEGRHVEELLGSAPGARDRREDVSTPA